MNLKPLQVFCINLSERTDRRTHIEYEFSYQKKFDIHVVAALPHKVGAISLWQTIQHIVQNKINKDEDYFILCEDDHQFTKDYSCEYLKSAIKDAKKLDADILSGGVSWFQTGVQISKNLFWIDRFSGLQFTVIFRKFYQKILDVKDFGEHDDADYKISDLTDKKFVIHPFISIQKEFGYSDVTLKNRELGRVENLFKKSSRRLYILKKIMHVYKPDTFHCES